MPDFQSDFLNQITAIVEENISNEQFGVSELADAMNMSRSNLLRRVKKLTNLSVSQLISQVRLKRAMTLLRTTSLNVSEVSHQVGFGSTSYFIKCFREYYGYPPGEAAKKTEAEINPVSVAPTSPKRNLIVWIAVALIITIGSGILVYYKVPLSNIHQLEKSIAVLPFKNDSNDSTNVYLINGLMESTLNNLQQIEGLRVLSRTSAEKYRNTAKSIPEMAKELNVNYFVEGSGQKIGDRILLNIQLIEASSDRHLWSKQYRREAKDIFELQEEIAKNIADEIEVIITPEVAKRIQKKPTENLAAYDLFLKGRDRFYKAGRGDLEASIPYFKQAVELDNKFALAYAEAAIVYYYLDMFQEEKKYGADINDNADKALLHDSKLAESMVAKALSYIHKKEFDLAVTYLEKGLEYNPNSILIINFLSDIYNIYTPNTAKYLENALKGLRLGMGAYDSATTSFIYLHISNAFIQTGFIDESIKYMNRSLDYNPNNPFSRYIKILFTYAKTRDLEKTRIDLNKELSRDTTRVDILKEMGKLCYNMRDYKSAYKYYKNFTDIREAKQLKIFQNEDLAIAFIYSKMGFAKEAEKLVTSFKSFADADKSIYHNLHLTLYYLYLHEDQKAIEHLALFSKEENYQFWVLLLVDDPLADQVKDSPEFKKVMKDVEEKFWKTNKEIKKNLEEKGLM